MEETEQLRQQLQKQEKLASLGILSAGIAHEIQNPLNFVINFSKMSEALLSDLSALVGGNAGRLPEADRCEAEEIIADLRANMAKILEHGERAVSIVRGILLVSRGKENEAMPTDVCKLVREYVWLSYHAMRANNKQFNVSIHEHYQEGMPMMMVVPQDLSRAVLNVANNACHAVWEKQQTAGDDYHAVMTVDVHADDSWLVISIADNGIGMNEEVRRRLFDNFFTTKPIGQGTGLGLGITRDIIENKHGGKVSFQSTEGQGSVFHLTIPVRK